MEIALENMPKIGAALALLGFLAVIIAMPDEPTMKISEIGKMNIGQKAKFYGTIRNLEIKNGNAFFGMENSGSIKSVFFNPKANELHVLVENRPIEAIATISKYRGELELIVEKVREID